jgi:hypothetical protein
MLEKIEGSMKKLKNGQSRDTGNIWHTGQNTTQNIKKIWATQTPPKPEGVYVFIFHRYFLQVGDRKFTAHRIVLAGTIPYFHAMFTHDMVESKQDEISMQGIDPK